MSAGIRPTIGVIIPYITEITIVSHATITIIISEVTTRTTTTLAIVMQTARDTNTENRGYTEICREETTILVIPTEVSRAATRLVRILPTAET